MIVEIVRQKIKVGTVLQNPSKGNYIVEKYTEGSIRYKRGKSSIYEKVNFSTVRKYPKFLSSYRNNC